VQLFDRIGQIALQSHIVEQHKQKLEQITRSIHGGRCVNKTCRATCTLSQVLATAQTGSELRQRRNKRKQLEVNAKSEKDHSTIEQHVQIVLVSVKAFDQLGEPKPKGLRRKAQLERGQVVVHTCH